MTVDTYPVRSEYRANVASQLVTQPASALLTVSEDAAAVLKTLGIETVFDLGASILFDTARRIVDAADPSGAAVGYFIGADFLDAPDRGKTAAVLADSPIAVLRQVGDATAAEIASKLGVSTVRELAAWPAYRAAREVLNDAYGLRPSIVDDFERPDDLIPVARRYATERVQYDVVVMDRVLDDPRPKPIGPKTKGNIHIHVGLLGNPRDLASVGAIDIGDLVAASLMARPAIGAVLTYRQSWFPQGLALGQLLHSMALAPGESTRVAMVDWQRSVRASTTEDTTQSEALSASMERGRAMSEVTSAVATEAQAGFSGSSSRANQEQSGSSGGIAGIIPFVGAAVGSFGASSSSGTASTSASGWASSSGQRSLNASMTQNITDRTHQAANSVRNRRATAVTETSQKESETLTTRVVTNYNHMHALTMQYFEVVQVYRVVVELARTTRCLFVPMKLVSFTPDVVQRYRSVLASAGLTPEVRALSAARARSLVVRAPQRQGTWDPTWLDLAEQAFGDSVGAPGDAEVFLPIENLTVMSVFGDPRLLDAFDTVEVYSRQGAMQTWSFGENPGGILGGAQGIIGDGGFAARDLAQIVLRRKDGQEAFKGNFSVALGFDAGDGSAPSAADRINSTLILARITVKVPANASAVTLFSFDQTFADADVIDQLEQNALHYSTAIWRSLDAATITTLLSSYEFEDRQLIEVIDPVPVSVSGNYVVFRLYGGEDAAEWQGFLERHDLRTPMPVEDLIPLPSTGVFAEAVLGRSNSAEKLDISRFWNWQDSPIPILPPDINALNAGGKANDGTATTGNLESPIVNIMNAPALPDPAGLGPLYSAISNGNMFRDMSGMAQIAALAGTTMGAAQSGAGQAMTAAGAAQQSASKLFTDIAQMAIQAALAANGLPPIPGLGGGGGGGGGAAAIPQNPTNLGALLGNARDMDRREAAASDTEGWAPYPGTSDGSGTGSMSTPPLMDAPDDQGRPVAPLHESAVLYGAQPGGRENPITTASWRDRVAALPVTGRKEPQVIQQGEAAYAAAARILPIAQSELFSTSRGPLRFSPGDVLPHMKVVVVAPHDGQGDIFYLEDDKLYRYDLKLFIERFYWTAVEQAVAQASWIIQVGKFEVAIITGLLVPWYLLLAVSGLALSLRVYDNREVVALAMDNGGKLIRALRAVRDRYPTLYKALLKTTAREALENLPSGITAEDVGFLLGRLVRASAASVEDVGQVAVKPIMLAIAKTAAIVAATHLPSITAHAVAAAADQHKTDLRAQLQAAGIDVSEADAKLILKELYNDLSNQKQTLQDLQDACEAFAPAIEQLMKDVPTRL